MLRINIAPRAPIHMGAVVLATTIVAGCAGASIPGTPGVGAAPGVSQTAATKTEKVTMEANGNQLIQVPYYPGSGQSLVTFKTLPGASCHLTGDTSRSPWTIDADQAGNAQFAVSIANSASHQEAIQCVAGSVSQYVSVSYVRSATPLASIIKPPLPIPSEAQMESVAASLGFDPRTAPESVLESHNLPPRPDDFATNPAASLGWLKAVFTPTTSLVTTASGTVVPGVYNGPIQNLKITGTVNNGLNVQSESSNWSGYDAAGIQGTINTVRAYWTVPTLSPTSANPAYSGTWVGIDGGPCEKNPVSCDGNVYQDGTAQTFSSSGGVNHFTYIGWWEEYPYNAETELFPVNPGDEMYGTFWKNIQNDTVYGQYYLKDLTTGATSNFAIVVGSNLVGNSGEWIVEAPMVNGSRAELADYGSTEMTEAELVSGSTTTYYDQWPAVSSYDLYEIEMVGASGVDSEASDVGTGEIMFQWEASD